jgi:hypothetical protein
MVLYLADAGEHANAYMRLLEIEARQIVDRNWELIEALAHALIPAAHNDPSRGSALHPRLVCCPPLKDPGAARGNPHHRDRGRRA